MTAGAPDPAPIGFVSRAWRPIPLVHAPVQASVRRERVLAAPAWAGSVPGAAARRGTHTSQLTVLVGPE